MSSLLTPLSEKQNTVFLTITEKISNVFRDHKLNNLTLQNILKSGEVYKGFIWKNQEVPAINESDSDATLVV